MNRETLIASFLAGAGYEDATFVPLAADASFRRYFRLQNDPPLVVMDAPPDKEDVIPFMAVTNHLSAHGLSSPRILASDIADGLLLLEDLGDNTFTRLLNRGDGPTEAKLYKNAVDILLALHLAEHPTRLWADETHPYDLPTYDAEMLLDEASLFTDWYMPAKLSGSLPPDAVAEFAALWRDLLGQVDLADASIVLRDYHADNLMWLPERRGNARVGLLDFQDAVIGPPAYDLVSLLLDCRRVVPGALESTLIEYYLNARPELDVDAFEAAYSILGAQRNTKIIGIFTRLWVRDGKPHYPSMIPRTWELLEKGLGHTALADLKIWFDRHIPPDIRATPLPNYP